MKIEISKELENEIDAMIGVAKQASKIKEDNPIVWGILTKQFLPDRSFGEEPIKDSEENLKVRLYAEIIKKQNETAVKVERKIKSK